MLQEIASESGDDGYESGIDIEQTMRGLKCQLFTAVTCKIPDFIEKLDTNDVCWYLIERHKMLKISKVLNCIIIHISAPGIIAGFPDIIICEYVPLILNKTLVHQSKSNLGQINNLLLKTSFTAKLQMGSLTQAFDILI